MKSLFKYLKPYMKECIAGPLFKFTEACFELIVPLVTAAIIDKGIPAASSGDGYGYILKMGGVMVLFGLLGLVCSLTAQYFCAKAALGFASKTRSVLFKHIIHLPREKVDKYGIPTLITRVTGDVNRVQIGVNMFLRLVLRTPFIVLGAVLMSFTVDVKMGVIVLASVPVIAVVIFMIMKTTVPMHKDIQNTADKSQRQIRENLIGARVVRAFVRQEAEINEFNKTADELNRRQNKSGKISVLISPLNTVIINAVIIIVLLTGGVQIRAGELSQGDVIAIVNYLNQILIALVALAGLVTSITRATASASRIEALLCEKTEKECEGSGFEIKSAPEIEFKNVSFSYYGSEEKNLENISFKLLPGQCLGIIGGTGSGKSTVANLIQHFYDASEGEILIDGVNIDDISLSDLRSAVSVVLQETVLFKGSIRQNILWGKENASDAEIWEALRIAQAADFVKEKKGMLDYIVEAGGRNLSGGQRQRLCIARAIVGNPKLLIFDDSSSALDFATEAALRKALAENFKDTTTVIISQRTTGISFADKIIVMDDGRISGSGTHEELLQSCELYKEIHMSQISGGGE